MRLELSAGIELDVLGEGDESAVYAKVWDDSLTYATQTAKALTVEGVLEQLAPTAPPEKVAAAADVLEGILGIEAQIENEIDLYFPRGV